MFIGNKVVDLLTPRNLELLFTVVVVVVVVVIVVLVGAN